MKVSSPGELHERILVLEERVAHQERLLADLDDVLRAFTTRVQTVERELARLRESIVQGHPTQEGPDDPPPHY